MQRNYSSQDLRSVLWGISSLDAFLTDFLGLCKVSLESAPPNSEQTTQAWSLQTLILWNLPIP
jgi:hypothetical protein